METEPEETFRSSMIRTKGETMRARSLYYWRLREEVGPVGSRKQTIAVKLYQLQKLELSGLHKMGGLTNAVH